MDEAKRWGDDRRHAKDLAQRGHASWKQGNHFEAIEWFSRALSADPDDAWTLMRRGAARAAIGDVAGAAQDLNRARAMAPGDAGSSQRRWAAEQLGEGIRVATQDAALAPDAGTDGAEALLATIDGSIGAFTEALLEDAGDAWAYAHRGAASLLAYWIGARFGVDTARVRAYAESAQSDLDTAMRLKSSYSWAMVLHATLLTLTGANEPGETERRALFDLAAARVEEAGRVDQSFPALPPLIELALYTGDYDRVVALGWEQLAKDPDDAVTRYCVAWTLKRIAETSDASEPAVAEARQAAADAFIAQTRRAILARRSRLSAMLGGLAMLEGKCDVAAATLDDVAEYPDLHTVAFMQCEPAWAPLREPAAGAESDPRLSAVVNAYRRLFPSMSGEKRSP